MSRGPTSLTRRWRQSFAAASLTALLVGIRCPSPAHAGDERPLPDAVEPLASRAVPDAVEPLASRVAAVSATDTPAGNQPVSRSPTRNRIEQLSINLHAPQLTSVASPTDAAPSEPRSLPTGGDKTGVTGQALSLPSGEGKIHGMGESFSAQLSTGVATFTIPLTLPAARGLAQPAVKLNYTSSVGHGVAGVGWSVDVPFISESDGAAFVLARGDRCAEIVHLLRWDSREWRYIDKRPVDVHLEQLTHIALWRTVEIGKNR